MRSIFLALRVRDPEHFRPACCDSHQIALPISPNAFQTVSKPSGVSSSLSSTVPNSTPITQVPSCITKLPIYPFLPFHDILICPHVLKTRPKELLGMFEEAARTLMSEGRKDKAKKATGKREMRVDEIATLLAEEITPELDTLHARRASPIHAILK